MTWQQKFTVAVIVVLIVSVAFFKVDVGMGAFIGAVLLTLFRAANERFDQTSAIACILGRDTKLVQRLGDQEVRWNQTLGASRAQSPMDGLFRRA